MFTRKKMRTKAPPFQEHTQTGSLLLATCKWPGVGKLLGGKDEPTVHSREDARLFCYRPTHRQQNGPQAGPWFTEVTDKGDEGEVDGVGDALGREVVPAPGPAPLPLSLRSRDARGEAAGS